MALLALAHPRLVSELATVAMSTNKGDKSDMPKIEPTSTQSGDPYDGMRRADLLRNTPAELAIREALLAVEHVGADVRLTDSVILLGQARERLADFIDGVRPDSTLNARYRAGRESMVKEIDAILKAEFQAAQGGWRHDSGVSQPAVPMWLHRAFERIRQLDEDGK